MKELMSILLLSTIVFVGCTTTTPTEQTESTSSQSNSSTTVMEDQSAKNNKYDKEPKVLGAKDLKSKTATIKTSKGDITVELNGAKAPASVSNFIFLADEDFYDGLTFHRVEPGFVIQGGDPLGTGTGGPGYTVEGEVDNGLKHDRGVIAMARTGDAVNPERRSSGSQFYITLDATPFLDGQYTVFGKVTDGMDVVDSISIGDVIEDIVIN